MRRIALFAGMAAAAVAAAAAMPARTGTGEISPPAPVTTVLFVGDLMFDRGVAKHAETYGVGPLFRGVETLFDGPDAIVGNLEGTITTEPSVASSHPSVLHFTFDPKFAELLSDEGFTALSQANNHSSDFLATGAAETRRFLSAAGVIAFGSAYNDRPDMTAMIRRNGETICVVGYHDLYTEDAAPALAEIRRVRPECSFLAVFPHWGVEYRLAPTDRQRALAHEFIDAGADLVIGSHPHVVEPVEIYEGKAIFYSLGNFIFDQGLSFWTEHGLAVQVGIGSTTVSYDLIPTVLHSTEASVATSSADIARVLGAAGRSATFDVAR